MAQPAIKRSLVVVFSVAFLLLTGLGFVNSNSPASSVQTKDVQEAEKAACVPQGERLDDSTTAKRQALLLKKIADSSDHHDAQQESADDVVADRELKLPPLLRTPWRTSGTIGNAVPGKVRGDYRVMGETANPYSGQYGWVFVRYTSSQLELDFFRDVAAFEEVADWSDLSSLYRTRIEALKSESEGRVAPHRPYKYSERLIQECNVYVRALREGKRGEQNRGSQKTCLGNAAELDKALFSQFEYEYRCLVPPCSDPPPKGFAVGATHTSYIEPLVGILRHPNAFLHNATRDLLNKEYMIIDKWALHHLRTRYLNRVRKSHYFDLGASTYTTGAGGPSQVWFEALAECLCVPFTMMHLWEAKPHDPSVVWRQVPEDVQPRYQWYNQPLNSSRASWNNPLNHLLHHASHDDVVFLKVDFDQVRIEADIVRTVIERPELYSQIDELFFEHHVKLGPMTRLWTTRADKSMKARDSIGLFMSLRRLGIRAHSWV